MEKLVYSVKEVAVLLGISKSFAYQLVKEKKIPVVELDGRKIIPKQALNDWLQENIILKESR